MPSKTYSTSGSVTDLITDNNLLYVATDSGCVDILELKTQKSVNKICVPQIVDFIGDKVASKIYSVDRVDSKMLILSQTKEGYRRLHIYENETLRLVINYHDNLAIAKAKFVSSNTVLLALLSNDIILYDIKNKKQQWNFQSSLSKFSDFVLNEQKSEVIISDESGELQIHSTKDGKHLKTLSGENLDNVYQVDTKNGVIITAGQDRRCAIYKGYSSYYKKASFLIYSVGLSPSGKIGAFASNEDNDVTLFNTKSKEIMQTYTGSRMSITKIFFLNEKEFLVSSDDSVINYYKIDKVK
jgi:outer membrane protein assembly factor BamB